MAISVNQPAAPTIEDLLARQGGSPITSRQDEARKRLLQGITNSRAPDPSDRWGNVQHALQTGINYYAGHDAVKRAEQADTAEQERQAASRKGLAEMLVSQGYSPQEAVGLAAGSGEDRSLAMNLMGMKREEDYRQQQAQTDQSRFDQKMDLQRDQFDTNRQDAALGRRLQQQSMALQQAEVNRAQEMQKRQDMQNVARQGHIESMIAGLPEDQRAMVLANPDGYIKAQQAAGNDEFAIEVRRILQANPDLAQSEDGIRQAQNAALGLVKSATDPVRGGTATYNLATGQGSPIQTPNPSLEKINPDAAPITVDSMAGEIGAVPFAEDVIAKTLGQAAPSLVNEARTKAASQLDFVKQRAITAFATSSRPPVIEQQRIESLFPSKGIFDSEERARQQLSHLRTMAATTHDEYVDLVNSGQLPHKQENELRGKIAELQNVVRMMPDNAASLGPADVAEQPTNQDLGEDPLGLFN